MMREKCVKSRPNRVDSTRVKTQQCQVEACWAARLRGYAHCIEHQLTVDPYALLDDDADELFPLEPAWICIHGAEIGSCFLNWVAEFPGLGETPYHYRDQVYAVSLN